MTQVFEGVVAVATRGVVFTEVFDGIIKNIVPRTLAHRYWTVRSSWKKPIPEAQNDVMEEALKLTPDLIWFVEEDTVPPLGILGQMISMNEEVVVADYRLDDGSASVKLKKCGKLVLHGGIGCMLVRRSALARLKQPWFSTGNWQVMPDGSFGKHGTQPAYGTVDTSFFVRLKEAGITAVYAGTGHRCKHLRLDDYDGSRKSNNGLHKIREL